MLSIPPAAALEPRRLPIIISARSKITPDSFHAKSVSARSSPMISPILPSSFSSVRSPLLPPNFPYRYSRVSAVYEIPCFVGFAIHIRIIPYRKPYHPYPVAGGRAFGGGFKRGNKCRYDRNRIIGQFLMRRLCQGKVPHVNRIKRTAQDRKSHFFGFLFLLKLTVAPKFPSSS